MLKWSVFMVILHKKRITPMPNFYLSSFIASMDQPLSSLAYGGWEPSASAGRSALRSDTDSLRDQRSPLRSPEEGFSSWHSDHNIPFHTLMASTGKLGKELHHHLCDASPQAHRALQA